MEVRKKIIENYVEGYNDFDIPKMIRDFSDDVIFENVQNGKISMTLSGIKEFINQAEKSMQFFSQRKQTILSFRHESEKTEIEIDYYGVLEADFPNGLKKGQEIKMKGKSIFEFREGKIIKLTDIS
jgi:ketosteroid isomerase-like protein